MLINPPGFLKLEFVSYYQNEKEKVNFHDDINTLHLNLSDI